MAYTNHLFQPLNETILDQATNNHFSLKGLVFDARKKDEGPKTLQDKLARHVIFHGKMPDASDLGLKKKEDSEEAVKEDNFMSDYSDHLFKPYSLQEGSKCGCGKKGCPVCNPKNRLKLPVREAEGNATGIAQQVGLGTPSSTANHLYQIPINQYQDSDASFITDGDSAETSKTNIPALLAAKNAGGKPHPFTISNGINGREKFNGFKLKDLTDDYGPNG